MEDYLDSLGYTHYVYKIVNTTNNKYYIGVHSVYILEKGIDITDKQEIIQHLLVDGYWGSSRILSKDIKFLGLVFFKKQIIEIFNSRDKAMKKESLLVDLDSIKNPMCYNLAIGGGGKYNVGSMKKVIDLITGKTLYITNEIYEENKHIFKLTSSTLGKKYITNGIDNKTIFNFEELPAGWRFGRTDVHRKTKEVLYKYRNIENNEILKRKQKYSDWEKDFNNDCLIYPIYFFSHNELITYEKLQTMYDIKPSWTSISRDLGIKYHYLIKIVKFFENHLKKEFKSNNIIRRASRAKTTGFTGKTYVTDFSSEKVMVVDKKDLHLFTKTDNILVGKKVDLKLFKEKQQIEETYIKEIITLRDLAKLHKTSVVVIKGLLGLFNTSTKIYKLVKDNLSRRGLFNDRLVQLLLKSGWKIV